MARAQFDAACGPEGHLLVGSPQQVVEKILAEHDPAGGAAERSTDNPVISGVYPARHPAPGCSTD